MIRLFVSKLRWFFLKEPLFFANFLLHILTILSTVMLYFVSIFPVSEVLRRSKYQVWEK